MTTVQNASRGLTAEQVDTFHREGCLILTDLFGNEDLQPAIDDINRAIDAKVAELSAAGSLSQRYAEFDFEHRLARISRETDQVALSLWNGVLHGPGLFELITNPKLLDAAESLCGEELVASSVYRLRPKIPNYNYGAVPWHQDSAYFEPYCDKSLVLTVWIPLVDANAENGCLWVIPRVHTGKIAPHRPAEGKAYLEILEQDLPPGDRILLSRAQRRHALVDQPHAARQLREHDRHRSMVVGSSLPERLAADECEDQPPARRIGAAGRTMDEPGFVPVACHPPEADFLVRSRTRSQEILRTAEQFAELRTRHVPTPVSDRWGKWWNGEANNPGRG